MQVLPCSEVRQRDCSKNSLEKPSELVDREQEQLTNDRVIGSEKVTEMTQTETHMSNDEDESEEEDENNVNDCHVSAGKPENKSSNGVKSTWLEVDESIAVWAMWRGKWEAGIRCSRADWPLSALKANPSHGDDGKEYFVVFFPQTGVHLWAEKPHVCSIHETPLPIGYKTHKIGVDTVKDLTISRRFIMRKIAEAMLNLVEQCHTEALIATAREAVVWKEFALEASRCDGYPELGRMLLKLQNMISSRYINAEWLLRSFNSWVWRCQNANTAESIEALNEELFNSIRWNEIQLLKEAPVQPLLGSDWKTWKHEALKFFSRANTASDGSLSSSPQISRKRPKLEVRRAEHHALQTENRSLEQSGAVEIDSAFFGNVADKWNGIVVEAEKTSGLEVTPLTKSMNRQCTAFIESKGRQCVRWANDGDVYCCVHLSSRFSGGSAKLERTNLFNDAIMCEGTTVLGTKCKHRSLPGLSFCKKHRPKTEISDSSANIAFKRKHEENAPDPETVHGSGVLEVNPVVVVQNDSLLVKPKLLAIEYKTTTMEALNCIGSCSWDDSSKTNSSAPCGENPKRHGLYCEKHLPSWLKRARNGKSRIVSKEVFLELLRDCHAPEQKIQLHQACELFYRLFKSILSLRNQVPKEVQFQWALSEASKDVGVGELFTKLVSTEKERLVNVWGFSATSDNGILTPVKEDEPARLAILPDLSQSMMRCKICSEAYSDTQALGNHWRDRHKKEAQWLFRGYACAICLDSFTNKKVLESHVQERHHAQFVEQCMLLQCIPCRAHFGNAEELWLHVLSAHPEAFRLSAGGEDAPKALPLAAGDSQMIPESESRRFICKLCGLRFDLLPDLGRHHQAAHMTPSLTTSRPSKKGVRYFAYRMKSGRMSRPKFKKTAAAASYRIRNRAAGYIKKRIQASTKLSAGLNVLQPRRVTEAPSAVEESQCSSVAQILFSEIQKTKPRPKNSDILSAARSTCCAVNLKASMESKYGELPKRLYLKAAKICGENGILVSWHRDGFVCPKGCKALLDPQTIAPLGSLSNGFVGRESAVCFFEPVNEKYTTDECHYVLDSADLCPNSAKNFHMLCDDISFGKESVRVACVADHDVSVSDSTLLGGCDGDSNPDMPWVSFTYITKPLIHESISLDEQSFETGCACRNTICRPETCNHVYLFDCDYDDARDVHGRPMHGRFPYDERSRIILEEGYLVYECNRACSCPKACPNRVLQNGVRVKLEVFKTEEKGWGVRAGEAIMRGTFICEYAGEVLDEQQANDRRKRYGKEGCNYVFEMDSNVNDMSRLIEDRSLYVIDATKYGNVSRFVNHSCSPNLVSHQVLVESMDCQGSHIGLYANRDISLGEELTYDYRYSFVPGQGFSCRCGASTCRGSLN